MDSIAINRLRESIKDAREIRLACLQSSSDIKVIHERAVRLYFNLCLIFDQVYAGLGRALLRANEVNRDVDKFICLDDVKSRYFSLPASDRDAILERARLTLPPMSQNDGDAVLVAALELLAAGERHHDE